MFLLPTFIAIQDAPLCFTCSEKTQTRVDGPEPDVDFGTFALP
jgi:hypothetical protein